MKRRGLSLNRPHPSHLWSDVSSGGKPEIQVSADEERLIFKVAIGSTSDCVTMTALIRHTRHSPSILVMVLVCAITLEPSHPWGLTHWVRRFYLVILSDNWMSSQCFACDELLFDHQSMKTLHHKILVQPLHELRLRNYPHAYLVCQLRWFESLRRITMLWQALDCRLSKFLSGRLTLSDMIFRFSRWVVSSLFCLRLAQVFVLSLKSTFDGISSGLGRTFWSISASHEPPKRIWKPKDGGSKEFPAFRH